MIGRRCTHSNVFSRPVLIARNLLSSQISSPGAIETDCVYLSQVIYCGGYSGVEPPLPIPNREVKRTSADGTAPPGGRVGRCRFSKPRTTMSFGAFFFEKRQRPTGPYARGGTPPRAPLCRSAPNQYVKIGMLLAGRDPFRRTRIHASRTASRAADCGPARAKCSSKDPACLAVAFRLTCFSLCFQSG